MAEESGPIYRGDGPLFLHPSIFWGCVSRHQWTAAMAGQYRDKTLTLVRSSCEKVSLGPDFCELFSLCTADPGAGDPISPCARFSAHSSRFVFRRSDGRRREFQGTHLCLLTEQHDGSCLRCGGSAVAGI